MNKKFLYVALAFLAIIFIIYSPGIQAPRYGDDFTIVPKGDFKYDLVKIWTSTYQRSGFYRPLEDTITATFIMFFGWNTIPTHILFILIHSLFAAFLYYVMIKLKYSNFSAFFGSLFMLTAQVNVTSVGGNDTLGMLLTSSLSFLSLWFLYKTMVASDIENKGSNKLYVISLLLITINLFCKESGVAFYSLFAVLLLLKNSFFFDRSSINIKKTVIQAIPFVIIFIIFYSIRSGIVPVKPSFGEGTYNFHLGLNIPRNIAMLLFSIFLPVSSVKTFEATEFKDYKFLAAVFIITAAFAGTVFYGIWRSKKTRAAVVLLAFIVAGFFPFALLNHVNEQYTYFSIPFAGMLVGIGIGYYFDNMIGWKRTVITVMVLIIILINSASVMEKTNRINQCGIRSDKIFAQLVNYLPAVEHNGYLVLVNKPNREKNYSAFKIPDFEIMRYSQFMVYKLAGREDFTMEVIEWNEQDNWKRSGVLMLRLDEEDKIIKIN